MKKIILLIVVTFIFKTNFAQIPNGGFELLDSNNLAQHWGFGNMIFVGICDSTLIDGPTFALSTQSNSGAYAMELRNTLCYAQPNSYYGGYVVSQREDSNLWVGTSIFMPINTRPERINFYYLYTQNNYNDSAICSFSIYDINNQEFGNAEVKVWKVNSGYEITGANIYYYPGGFENLVPHHFTLRFNSWTAASTPHLGTRLLIDDIAFGNKISGIDEHEMINQISIYPNPSNDFFMIKGLNEETKIIIKDAAGKSLMHFKNNINGNDIHQLQNGVYFVNYKLNNMQFNQKLIVVH